MSEINKTAPHYALSIDGLKVEFDTYGGVVKAVRGVSYRVEQGETLAVVGESGCGKSVTVQSLMGLIPTPPGRITEGSVTLNGKELVGLPVDKLNKLRGVEIGMIFQDPMTSLNPTMKVGEQIAETLVVHKGISKKEAFEEAVTLLERTRIPEARKRADQYPFEFSGGMLQRVMIAMTLACKPSVLIADEPTTALDVTIQNQVLELMREIQQEQGMSIVLITHDLGVVARMADHVAVMYAGQIVESGTAEDIFYRSAHPYTVGLRGAMPNGDAELVAIDGTPPDLFHPPQGCGYYARCPHAMALCETQMPPVFPSEEAAHYSRCWLQHVEAPECSGVTKIDVVEVSE